MSIARCTRKMPGLRAARMRMRTVAPINRIASKPKILSMSAPAHLPGEIGVELIHRSRPSLAHRVVSGVERLALLVGGVVGRPAHRQLGLAAHVLEREA